MKKSILGALLFSILLFCFSGTAMAAEQKPYYITVNLTKNIVTVYEKDAAGNYTVPIKVFYCSSGKSTPEGTFQTTQKYEWRVLFGNVWGQYATRITGHYLFHSVPYLKQDKTTLEYDEYNKLGSTASAGCIRLCVKDVKWIYDHCPIGTTVKMYRGDVQEPLQPTPVMKINTADTQRRGWDPTDPSPANPWRKGEMQKMLMQSCLQENMIEAYYEYDTYYFAAPDASDIFSHFGIALQLPESEEYVKDDTVSGFYDGKKYCLDCRVRDGKVYYKLRSLAAMVGVQMTWDRDTQKILISDGTEEVSLMWAAEDILPVETDLWSSPES